MTYTMSSGTLNPTQLNPLPLPLKWGQGVSPWENFLKFYIAAGDLAHCEICKMDFCQCFYCEKNIENCLFSMLNNGLTHSGEMPGVGGRFAGVGGFALT